MGSCGAHSSGGAIVPPKVADLKDDFVRFGRG